VEVELGAGITSPLQPEWPHRQTIAVLSASPSQYALQNFSPLSAAQLQVAFAHLFVSAIFPTSCPSEPSSNLGGHGQFDAPEQRKDGLIPS
jgi:hypothetical protein